MTFKRDSEFTDLTKAQVEALLECFDFLHNGYLPETDYQGKDVLIIKLKHKKNGHRLCISIKQDAYIIFKDGRPVKMMQYRNDASKYRLMVNSDMSVGVVRLSVSADARLVSG